MSEGPRDSEFSREEVMREAAEQMERWAETLRRLADS